MWPPRMRRRRRPPAWPSRPRATIRTSARAPPHRAEGRSRSAGRSRRSTRASPRCIRPDGARPAPAPCRSPPHPRRRAAGSCRLPARCGRQPEFREHHVGPTSEPAGDPREERHQVRVGRPVRPRRVDRVAVHREEVARFGGLRRTEAPILLQILHVDADRDRRLGVGRADRAGRSREPSSRVLPIGRDRAVGVLVTQVPGPQRRVAGERRRRLTRQPRLGARDVGVRVPIAHAVGHYASAGHHAEPGVPFRAAERPSRDPVHATHMPGEQGGHDRQSGVFGRVGHRHQALEHRAVHAIGRRLERFPEQEAPHGVEAAAGDPREVLVHLRANELGPPPHRGPHRPVVDAQPEPRIRRISAHGPDPARRSGGRPRCTRRPCGSRRTVARPTRAPRPDPAGPPSRPRPPRRPVHPRGHR